MRVQKPALGAMSLLILMCLQACGTAPVISQPEVVRISPPRTLTEGVPLADFAGTTNGDLLDHDMECMGSLAAANLNLAKLRLWMDRTFPAEKTTGR